MTASKQNNNNYHYYIGVRSGNLAKTAQVLWGVSGVIKQASSLNLKSKLLLG